MSRTHGAKLTDANHGVRKARALELRIEGYSQAEIAQLLGVNQSTVSRMIKGALQERAAKGVDGLRELEQERVDALQKVMWKHAKQGDTHAAAVVTRLLDRRAKLLGLDAARDGAGAAGLIHQYHASVTIHTTEEAGRVLDEERGWGSLLRSSQAAHEAAGHATTVVYDAEVPLEPGTTQEEAEEQAKALVRATMPTQEQVFMRVYIFHSSYEPMYK